MTAGREERGRTLMLGEGFAGSCVLVFRREIVELGTFGHAQGPRDV